MANAPKTPAYRMGPWTAERHEGEGNFWYVQYEQEGKFYIIADVLTEEDAKLIAAAPKMLNTLEDMVDYMAHVDESGKLYPMNSEHVKHCRESAKSAIDEAKRP